MSSGNRSGRFARQIKFERGYKCQRCGKLECAMLEEWLHVHHIIKRTEAPAFMFSPDNVRVLCDNCHEIEELEGEMAYIVANPYESENSNEQTTL